MYESKSFANAANSIRLASYELADVKEEYRFYKFSVFAEVSNALTKSIFMSVEGS